MKTWAEKRQRDMETIGATELAEMFRTIVKLCELEEQISASRDSDDWPESAAHPVENSQLASATH
jgi:hypothetical protein